MKIFLLFTLISIGSVAAQKLDSLSIARLNVELSSFKSDLSDYSEKFRLQNQPDSIKQLCGELTHKTGVLLNDVAKTYGMMDNPYLEYAEDMAMASAMKDVSPELTSLYQTNALLKFLDEPKRPQFYKQLASLNKLADKTRKTKNAKKLLLQSKKLADSCQALYDRF